MYQDVPSALIRVRVRVRVSYGVECTGCSTRYKDLPVSTFTYVDRSPRVDPHICRPSHMLTLPGSRIFHFRGLAHPVLTLTLALTITLTITVVTNPNPNPNPNSNPGFAISGDSRTLFTVSRDSSFKALVRLWLRSLLA